MPKQPLARLTLSQPFHLPPTLSNDTNIRHLCCFSTLFISQKKQLLFPRHHIKDKSYISSYM